MSNTDNELAQVAAVIVLAAGGGTRMKSKTSKLLHEVAGKPMLSFAVSAAAALDPERLVVVVGHQREEVVAHLEQLSEQLTTAVQEEQLGTGHAVECGLAGLGDIEGDIVVTYADVPMLAGETLRQLVAVHRGRRNAVTVMTSRVEDPTGYGRIIREDDEVAGIVEDRDATEEQRAITEINSGIYVFDAASLREGLASLKTDNDQGERYLTDVVKFCHERSQRVGAHLVDDVWQTEGVNDRIQLARINQEMQRRIRDSWMLKGVTMIDPASTFIDVDVDLAPDVLLNPGVILMGATTIGEGAIIGPDSSLMDVEVGPGAEVIRTHGSFAVIGEGATVGPFAYLRPGTILGDDGKIGSFVETKNAQIGAGTKIPHLSYVGDAIVDEGANIGAGTIFANYDGVHKSTTHVGKAAFVGSNSVLVAPVDVGAGALVAAGSTITDDVPAGALGVARGRQRNVEGWMTRGRPDSKQAAAAAESDGTIHPAVIESREKKA
ncbi:bifunctional UDP-N-acetylglucosamine diphosphorylase/glucosamine-1-phosphate N-acetyltransferase GlmU [Tessaracoccus sp. ZS01]|uniref:bifunctional UDP-N-acetylglucosamine diphosphorylase/glucosamine-1-phosphate N-acetyltransferase GlmU n=1 Tax=Tessaracoccus sp. ZS01 TaxID=1906324 RepID=UPI00096DBA19|nr:bifunctional UDP-N-acetylglucosamine diphosphorylase/glucosamine-1-phosphate N-acetyltransferase GlmU [Tessaracoccus sp. ZS01]MCG6566953.1 bifunctional UDP-N-acetylglucosamine diphosphorylase/glucosamine-1-phosphate N-acetyltransferase GlmU [Tessaracoccus sp. ZS01]OMG58078.1 UDP-N-acetylglucosamine diphosphorylase/glucosamine-1-phosphate N-acetyltransferase [Tessaracoccus sp. ZS01]